MTRVAAVGLLDHAVRVVQYGILDRVGELQNNHGARPNQGREAGRVVSRMEALHGTEGIVDEGWP